MNDTTQIIVGFLQGIGISVQESTVANDSFLPGVCIRDGALIYDRTTLRWPGDLLHEAGHIATMPASMRSKLSDALDAAPEVPYAGEVEATAWAYAAIVHLRLDPSVLFHAEGYDGRSAQLITTYGYGVYPGCSGLAQAGMTRVGVDAVQAGVPPYPHMTQWLRGE